MPSRHAPRLAYVISSHGFGHGARSCAIIDALGRLDPAIEVEIWSAVPDWFFADSLRPLPLLHRETTDLGLVQSDALEEDLTATLSQLRHWVPPPAQRLRRLLAAFEERHISHVVCDISPLGLEAARAGGLPCALVENFTWDWIYRGYAEAAPELLTFADRLEETFAGAELRLQLEPMCSPRDGAVACPPVSRRPRLSRRAVRQQLGVPLDAPLVLVTMGGIEWDYGALDDRLRSLHDGPWLVIPGSSEAPQRQGRLVRLPHRSAFYHPDLIHAADGVLGKLGYSTVAEVWSAGAPFAYVPRRRFPESPPLEAWVKSNLPHLRIAPGEFVDGRWLDVLPELLRSARRPPSPERPEGAAVAARHLADWINGRPRRASPPGPPSATIAPGAD